MTNSDVWRGFAVRVAHDDLRGKVRSGSVRINAKSGPYISDCGVIHKSIFIENKDHWIYQFGRLPENLLKVTCFVRDLLWSATCSTTIVFFFL